MPKFFVKAEDIKNGKIIFSTENLKHLNVLRVKNGENIIVCDGKGTDYICKVTEISKENANVIIESTRSSETESNMKITLFQGLPKSDKMELIIEKCVELGVFKIIPVQTKNSIAKKNEKTSSKILRWQKISESASKQSSRGIIPEIGEVLSFKEALEQMKNFEKSFVAYEKADNFEKLCNLNDDIEQVAIFIGPEGGFEIEEINACVENKIIPFSLGKRILRTETAGFVTITLLLAKELGGV